MDSHVFIIGLLVVSLVLFAFEVIRADIIAIGVMLLLMVTGSVTITEGFSGFSNPAVITVIAMFILSHGLVRSGIADWAANLFISLGGNSPARITFLVMMMVGLLSSVMNNIGAVAVLMPAVFAVSSRKDYPVTKLLIPLSFGSLMGGLTTLIGTPPNLLVSMAMEERGFEGFKMFDFTPTGLIIMLSGALYMVFFGRKLLPDRKTDRQLATQYHLDEYVTDVIIPPGSPLAGIELQQAKLFVEMDITVLSISRVHHGELITILPLGSTILEANDRLMVEGNISQLLKDDRKNVLKIYVSEKITRDDQIARGELKLVEVSVTPVSGLIGESIRNGSIRHQYGGIVLALRRSGQNMMVRFTQVPLMAGDVLLVEGTDDTIHKMAESRDLFVASPIALKKSNLKKAPLAIIIMLMSILLAAFGILHISVAGFLGVLLMVITGVVRVQDIYHEIEWRVIFLIAGMMPLGIAMDEQHFGTAKWMADGFIALAGQSSPYILITALVLFTSMVTEVMSNAAAAVLIAPIAIAIATSMGFYPHPFIMAVAISASTTFLTPIGHQANVLVYGVGNYKFSDFARVGFWLNIITILIAIFIVPLFWPFTHLEK